jgi:CubicO group peptidase (beta-lactamase class C family)
VPLSKRNLIDLPRNLEAVTDHDPARETPAADVGLSPQAVEKIWAAVQAMYRTGLHPGIALTLRRGGKVILDRAIGHARGHGPGESGRNALPLRTTTPICLFSASKAVTAILAHKMVEQGRLRLDDRVADTIPEYAVQGKGQTTLRQLLGHRAGIPALPVRNIDPSMLTHWDTVIRLLCAAKPSAGLGQQQSYHAVTAGYIVGELVRRVTGKELPQVLREELAEPLGCRHFSYGLPPAEREQAALNYSTGPRAFFPLSVVAKRALGLPFEDLAPLSNTEAFLDGVVPAANLFSTADESCRFYEMLLRGGEFEGRRVLQPETVAAAIAPVSKITLDRTLLVPIRFSPGFILGEKPFGLFGGSCNRAFGHLGFINVVCWADPDRDISVALLNTGKSTAPESIPSLGRVLWAVAHYCKPLKRRGC